MKTHLPVLLRRALLLAMAAVCTSTLSYAEESTPEPSKTPEALPEDGVWDGLDVDYSWNTAQPKGRIQGGALKLTELTIKNGSAHFDNNAVTAGGNDGRIEGAAVHVNGSFTLDNNSVVSFSGNSMSGGKKIDSGAGLYVHGNTIITNNESVLFNDNYISSDKASGTKGYGAAIHVAGSYSTLQINDNASVTAEGNYLTCSYSGTSEYHRGAFLYSSGNNIIEINRNDEVTITGNHIEGKVPQGGAAIFVIMGNSSYTDFVPCFNIVDNGKVVISDNYADGLGYSSVNGGAIYVDGTSANDDTAAFRISGNTRVEITDNAAKGSNAKSGAIYSTDLALQIQGNDEVLFSGNYEKGSKGYCMRGLYVLSNVLPDDDNSRASLILSANESGYIEMQDGIMLLAKTPVRFNADYGDTAQTGDIIFTGAYAEENLNTAIAANTAAGETAAKATETEIANSQIFSFQHYFANPNVGATLSQIADLKTGVLATLEGGRLIIEDGAHYVGMGFEAVEGSNTTLRLKDAQFEHYYSRAGSYPCSFYYDVTLGAGNKLEMEGTNTLTAANLTMGEGSTMSFVVGSQNKEQALLTYIGGDKTTAITGVDEKGNDVWGEVAATSSLTQEGAMSIWVEEAEDLVRGQRYALLTISDNVTLNWDTDNLTVKGIVKASDLAWDGNTLYMTYNRPDLIIATWTDTEDNGLWDNDSYNWDYKEYLYDETDSVKVVFDDTAEQKEVTLVGSHTPDEVEVSNSAGNDYTLTGDGSMDGKMKLVKNGEGSLTISTANSYSGGTEINGGELIVDNDSALGSGKVSLKAGTLNLGSREVVNDIEATGGTLGGAEQYSGNLVVSEELTIVGNVTAESITLLNSGGITLQSAVTTFSRRAVAGGAVARTSAMYVRTEGDGCVEGDLILNEGGLIELNGGSSLEVTGSLTLGNGTSVVLIGNNYAAGDTLVRATESLTLGDVTLVYDNSTVEMEQQGNSLVLVSRFKQNQADMAVQGNWGIATASRAFVNAVRGQRTNTGCIADGRGTAWAAVLGAYHDMNGADISVQGAAVGADVKVGQRSSVGIAAGYTEGEVSPAGLSDVDQEGTYVALYGEHGLKKLRNNSCLSLDWVAAYGQTESKAAGITWEQDSVQLNTRLNWNRKLTDRLCMSVFGGLEYFATESDTAQGVKSGSIQNLRGELGVGARYVAWGAPAVADGKMGVLRPGCEKLVLNGEIRYMNDMVRSNPVVRMNGVSGEGANPGRQGIGIEAGATYRIGERWSASANYGFNTMDDSREHRVNVGAGYTF